METKVMNLNEGNIDTALVIEAAAALDAGELVAFPTETVYGIGCSVNSDSLKKLDQLKGRTKDKYYTLHIAKPDDAMNYVPTMGMRAKKLIKNAWPGPLTIIFELDLDDIEVQKKKLPADVFNNLYRDNSIGIRCPDNKIASMLLEETKNAVVAPSANLTGSPPAVDAEQVAAQFKNQIKIILNGGTCKHKISSTVVKLANNDVLMLRQGVLSESQVIEMAQVTILFVCTGNSCRSPIAEGIFKKYLSEKLQCPVDLLPKKGYNVISAGTIGMVGFPATVEAVRACADRNVDISGHRSRALNRFLIEQSDIIYALTDLHRQDILDMSPGAKDKCFLLAAGKDINDPIGQSQQYYDRCAGLIDTAVKKRIEELKL
jgi:L-threonylcarbamoyladenylate synthase